jgi:hypothetical protein
MYSDGIEPVKRLYEKKTDSKCTRLLRLGSGPYIELFLKLRLAKKVMFCKKAGGREPVSWTPSSTRPTTCQLEQVMPDH